MKPFQKLSLEDLELVRPYFRHAPWRTCDFSVGGMFMWRDFYHIEYCIEEDVLYVRQRREDGTCEYLPPLCGDIPSAVRHLVQTAGDSGIIRFCTAPEAFAKELQAMYPETVLLEDRDLFDYLYRAETMKTFAGRHLAGQRNHIKHFERDHAGICFADITAENLEDAKTFFREVYHGAPCASDFEKEENRMTTEVLDHFDAYGFLGGILYADNRVAGFSLGEIVGDTLFVHIEKSRRDCDGCYQTLTRAFAERYCDETVEFVNREEDMGDEGLRYSKNAYHPLELLKKYRAEVPVS